MGHQRHQQVAQRSTSVNGCQPAVGLHLVTCNGKSRLRQKTCKAATGWHPLHQWPGTLRAPHIGSPPKGMHACMHALTLRGAVERRQVGGICAQQLHDGDGPGAAAAQLPQRYGGRPAGGAGHVVGKQHCRPAPGEAGGVGGWHQHAGRAVAVPAAGGRAKGKGQVVRAGGWGPPGGMPRRKEDALACRSCQQRVCDTCPAGRPAPLVNANIRYACVPATTAAQRPPPTALQQA